MSGLNKPFLKWWVQFVCTVFAVILSWELGWLHALYNADITKISILILALFAMTTGLTGYMSKNVLLNTSETQKLGNYVWFGSEAMITLGMIGTVAGFLIMLNFAFSGLDVQNTASVQQAIGDMAVGMSTALCTTLIGLICSVLTKVQMVILENCWNGNDDSTDS